ncbi:MAG: hypothetical protein HZC28_16285 [Spirochaetes bacterium]|nr:hypothetical protein [Spirochaetota bacterium]
MIKNILFAVLAASLCMANELASNAALKKDVETREARYNEIREQNRLLKETSETLLETALRVSGSNRNENVKTEPVLVMRLYTDEPVMAEKKEAGQKAIVQKWYTVTQDGKRYRFTAMVKGEGITGRAKFGLMYTSGGKTIWPAANIGIGSFEWKQVSFETSIPFGVKSYLLLMGIEGSDTGTIWFKDVAVELIP